MCYRMCPVFTATERGSYDHRCMLKWNLLQRTPSCSHFSASHSASHRPVDPHLFTPLTNAAEMPGVSNRSGCLHQVCDQLYFAPKEETAYHKRRVTLATVRSSTTPRMCFHNFFSSAYRITAVRTQSCHAPNCFPFHTQTAILFGVCQDIP